MKLILCILPAIVLAKQKDSKCAYRCMKDGSCEVAIDAKYGGRDVKFKFGQSYTWGSCASPYLGGGCTFTPPDLNCQECKRAVTCTGGGLICNSKWQCSKTGVPRDTSDLMPYHYDIDDQGDGYRVGPCPCENVGGAKCPLRPQDLGYGPNGKVPPNQPWTDTTWPAHIIGGFGDHPRTGECDGLTHSHCDSRNVTANGGPISPPRRKSSNKRCLGGISPRGAVVQAPWIDNVLQLVNNINPNDNVDVNAADQCPDAAYCLRPAGRRGQPNRCCKLIGLGNRRFGCPFKC